MSQRKNIKLMCIAIGLCSGQLPQALWAAPPASIVEYRVVGFTQTVTDGAPQVTDQSSGQQYHGFAAMDYLCQVEFGLGAKIATAAQFSTPWVDATWPMGPGAPESVWVDPGAAGLVYIPDFNAANDWIAFATSTRGRTAAYVDQNAQSALINISCTSFAIDRGGNTGTVGTPFGQVTRGSCSIERPVACAAPVAVPVTQ